jgi:predicted amidohydrolase
MSAVKTVRIAAAQTVEFREDIEAALNCVADVAARVQAESASLLCFPEGFLQGYLTDEMPARRNALDLSSPAFAAVLSRLPKTGPMIVMGLIELEQGRLFNTAVVVHRRAVIGRYRKAHLLGGEKIFQAGNDSAVFAIDGLRFGINICHDTNFPQAARKLADLGAAPIVCGQQHVQPRDGGEAQARAQFRAGRTLPRNQPLDGLGRCDRRARRAHFLGAHGGPQRGRQSRGSAAFGKARIVGLRYSSPPPQTRKLWRRTDPVITDVR